MPERDEVIDSVLERAVEEGLPEADIELCEALLVDNYGSLEFPVGEIKLQDLQIENFRVIKDRILSFDSQNTILFGQNEKGKTTSLEAIRFNLFGVQEKQRVLLTDPIRDGKATLITNGNWSIDGRDHLLRRTLTNGSGYDETIRFNTDPARLDDIQFGGPNTQEEVSRQLGLWPVESKQLGRYNIFSLYCLMQGNFKVFLKWRGKNDLLDMIFGIDLASVITESSRFRNEELELSSEEKTAPQNLADARSRISRIDSDLDELSAEQEEVEAQLSDRRSELDRVQDLLEEKGELMELESQETEIKRKINKLQDERQENLSGLRTVEQKISRYQEMDMGQHLHEPSEELQKYMSVPDRCPVCTREVEDDQRRRLLNDGDCPLCEKAVPTDRIEIGTERDVEEKIIEREQREEVLEEAKEQRREIKGGVNLLESRINDYEDELYTIQNQIQETDEQVLIRRKDELDSAADELQQRATRLQIERNARHEELNDLNERIPEIQEYYDSREYKVGKQESLETFERIVQNQINRERRDIKYRLKSTMKELLEIFEDGTLSSAFDVDFESTRGYDFVVRVRNGGDIPSDRANENSNEGKLTALLFHTAILKELSKHNDTLPLRMFIVDSPYSESPDITRFLQELPEILSDYQIILGVADTNMADRHIFTDQYNIIDF
jgi:DNA repair exonuclease SbcCD ATPase subunit